MIKNLFQKFQEGRDYVILFYKAADGKIPLEDYLNSKNKKESNGNGSFLENLAEGLGMLAETKVSDIWRDFSKNPNSYEQFDRICCEYESKNHGYKQE